MKYELRTYQSNAVFSCLNYFKYNVGNPILCLPTGSGKSLICAALVERIMQYPGQRVLILSHVKELLEQNYNKLRDYIPSIHAGIYSAGIGRKDTMYPVTVAGIQSIYKKADVFGHIDICIVDECHLLSPDSDTMYQSFFSALKLTNPAMKVIGLTATPWREKGGLLTDCTFFDDIAFNLPMSRLIKDGYLAPLISRSSTAQADVSKVGTVAGDYNKGQLAEAVDRDELTRRAVADMIRRASDRKKWLVFCSSVEHAYHVRDEIRRNGISCETVTGDMPKDERAAILRRYRDGDLRAVTNYGVLTTGFDAPQTDMIALLRPTKSVSLYVQMLGRGQRIFPGKVNCLVLDFGGNIERFGPVDMITIKEKVEKDGDFISVQPTKICPNCRADCHVLRKECENCGYEFDTVERQVNIEEKASQKSVMSAPPKEYEVVSTEYAIHKKDGKPDSIRVDYFVGFNKRFSEWICFDHGGYANKKARQWWFERASDGKIPNTTKEAWEVRNVLRQPQKISVDENSKFPSIAGCSF